MLCILLTLGQLPESADLKQLTMLRRGELVRCYERGGRTRTGLFQALIVVTPHKIFVKAPAYSLTYSLSNEDTKKWKLAIADSNPGELTQLPRKNPMFPSAYDATDTFLAYRHGSRSISWNNERFEEPRAFPLLEMLRRYRS